MRKTLLILVLGLVALPASADVLHLGKGRRLEGEVLKETPETLFVDVGFTVLAVPRREILRREASRGEGASEETAETVSGDLYRTADRKEMSVKDNVARVGSAVVLVSTPSGLGSGFIIHPDGYVVTNDHVIQGEQDITVTIFEKSKTGFERVTHEKVRIVAMNAYVDLALLQIEDVSGLPTVPLGSADRLATGQAVFAIGNPLGLERSVSEGIISTLNRPFEGLTYLQTTTQINPGNSGGPLFNRSGEVIGVTNMGILMAQGLNFAIPVDRVKWFLHNRDAFLFDKDNPNSGFRYLKPPAKGEGKSAE
jgi:serine protease Do